MDYQEMFFAVFDGVEKILSDRLSPGRRFWASEVPALFPADVLQEYGLWMAAGDLSAFGPGLSGSVSVSLVPGESRIGLFLPEPALSAPGYSLAGEVAASFDGRTPDIQRTIGDKVLFDRIYREDPFSAEWMIHAMQSPAHRSVLSLRVAGAVISLWESACRVLLTQGATGLFEVMLDTRIPLPAGISELLPVTTVFSLPRDDRWRTVVRTAMDFSGFRAAVSDLLGEDLIAVSDLREATNGH